MDIVIVESPAKAKTINKYLGANYEVLASFGHVRDLPAKNGSVDPDANFQMICLSVLYIRLRKPNAPLNTSSSFIMLEDKFSCGPPPPDAMARRQP